MKHENHLGSITIVDDGSEIVLSDSEDGVETQDQEEIVVVTPAPTAEPVESTVATPEPSYSPEVLLIAENQVNGLALETALVGLVMGFLMGVEVLKIWLSGSR